MFQCMLARVVPRALALTPSRLPRPLAPRIRSTHRRRLQGATPTNLHQAPPRSTALHHAPICSTDPLSLHLFFFSLLLFSLVPLHSFPPYSRFRLYEPYLSSLQLPNPHLDTDESLPLSSHFFSRTSYFSVSLPFLCRFSLFLLAYQPRNPLSSIYQTHPVSDYAPLQFP